MQKMTKKIIINSGIYENRVAILDNDILDEYYVEQEGIEQLFGNIYKGRVDSVLPGIGAAFVDIGTGKNGFLHISDVLEKSSLITEEEEDILVEDTRQKARGEIGSFLKVGQDLLVQVVKESVGTKGPRLTTHISIPGRFLVLTPFDAGIGVSKRISDPGERSRIKEILRKLNLPEGIGCIVRTAAKDMPEHNFKREIRYLLNLWARIKFRAGKVKPPAILYEEYDLILRTVRDQLTDDVEKLVVDSKEKFRRIARFLNYFMPVLKSRLRYYKGDMPVFQKYGIEEEIEKIFDRKISLKNGGSIVIEQTEGMVAIDVNTGKYKGKRDVENTIFRTNIEAAREIARQIRLRDIGGIIIIDFIDMKLKSHNTKVKEELESSLSKDKAKMNILSISLLGVVEMTRQRMRKNLESTMYKKCPYCDGRGLVKSATTLAMQVLRKVERASFGFKKREMLIKVHTDVYKYLMENQKAMLFPLEKRCRRRIRFAGDSGLHFEDVVIE